MGRFFLTSLAVIIVAIGAAGASEASLVLSKQSTTPEPKVTVTTPSKTTTPAKTAKPVLTPTPTAPVAAPTPPTTTPATPKQPTATVNGYVHMRSEPTTASTIVMDLYQGYVVSYSTVDSGDWQAITYNGQPGYVYKAYLNY